MRKIRELIVDDSVVIRRLLTDILARDPEIEVVGTAANGRIALQKLTQVNPDLVTLDIEMPELDGLATLPLLRKDYPKLPVIMFSTLTERGAAAMFEALARGATDYVAKPANVGSVAAGMESVRVQLIPKIKALCPFYMSAAIAARPASSTSKLTSVRPINRVHRCDAVVIGASTGGPQALTTVIKRLPADFPVPIVIVQHMPPVFTRHLANRLKQECALEVREASAGETLRAGDVLIAPGDFHLDDSTPGSFDQDRSESGITREFVSPGRRCPVSFCGQSVWPWPLRRRPDRNGTGWQARRRKYRSGRRDSDRSG